MSNPNDKTNYWHNAVVLLAIVRLLLLVVTVVKYYMKGGLTIPCLLFTVKSYFTHSNSTGTIFEIKKMYVSDYHIKLVSFIVLYTNPTHTFYQGKINSSQPNYNDKVYFGVAEKSFKDSTTKPNPLHMKIMQMTQNCRKNTGDIKRNNFIPKVT